MDVASLIVRAGYDGAALTRGLAKSSTEVQRFSGQFNALQGQTRTFASSFESAAVPVQRTAAALGNVARSTQAASSRFALINRETGQFTALGNRASNTAIGVAFGLEAIARGGSAAEGGLRTALRAVASFGAFLGPKGLIVSGAAAATAAIVDLFARSREEMEKTQLDFGQRISQMIQDSERDALKAQLKALVEGVPTLDPKTNTVALANGIKQLQRDSTLLSDSLTQVDRILRSLPRNKVADILLSPGLVPSDVSDSLDAVIQRLDQAKHEADGLRAAINATAQPLQGRRIEGKLDVDLAADAFKRLREEVALSVRSFEQVGGKAAALPGLAEQLVTLWDRAQASLAGQSDQLGEQAVELRTILASMESLSVIANALDKRAIKIVPDIDPTQIRDAIDRATHLAPKKIKLPIEFHIDTIGVKDLEDAVKKLQDAKTLFDLSELSGDQFLGEQAAEDLRKAEAAVREYAAKVLIAMTAANRPIETQRKLLAEIERIIQSIKIGAEPAKDLSDNIHAITTAGRGLLQVVDSIDEIDASLRRAIEGTFQLADSFAVLERERKRAFKAAENGGTVKADFTTLIGAAVGVAGALASIMKSIGLFGETESETERNRILRANTDEMSRLRLELSGFTFSVRQQASLARELASITFGPGSRFKEQVEALGFSLSELAVIAREKGIEIFDSAGNIIPAALHQFGDALRLAAEAAIQFSNRFEDQRTKLDLLNKARGLPDTAERAIADAAELFRSLSPELFDRYFGSLDLSQATASRQAIEAFLLDWFANVIPADLFDGFSDKNEIVTVIDAWLDGIGRMTDAANEFSASLPNQPQGFKIDPALPQSINDLATATGNIAKRLPDPLNIPAGADLNRWRFQATLPVNWVPDTWLNLKDRPFTPKTGPTSPKDPLLGRGSTLLFEGAVFHINAQDKSAEEIFAQVKEVAQRHARARGPFVKGADLLD